MTFCFFCDDVMTLPLDCRPPWFFALSGFYSFLGEIRVKVGEETVKRGETEKARESASDKERNLISNCCICNVRMLPNYYVKYCISPPYVHTF